MPDPNDPDDLRVPKWIPPEERDPEAADAAPSRPQPVRPPRPVRIVLPADDEKLLAECDVQTYRSSGPGGQHVNTTDSAVRLRHIPSGITVQSQSARSQRMNMQECIEKLRAEVARRQQKKKKRIPTRVSRAAKARTVEKKRKNSQKKANRRRPNSGD